MGNNRDNEETRRIKTEALTKRTSRSKSKDETQVIGKVNSNKAKGKKGKKRKNKKMKFRDKHPRIATIIGIILIILVVAFIIGCGVVAGTIFNNDALRISKDELVIDYENSTLYDIDGNEIGNLSNGTKRKSISLQDMSEYLPKAYVAIEDERFYSHRGVDIKRTGAATITYIFNGGKSSFGGSTITQQVVKNITKDKEDNALRKVKEMAKALQVENYLSKDQILELYLNLIFVGGDDINGVELGSLYYFSKSAKDLSIAECAFMAGINNSPNMYKPFDEDPEGKNYDLISKRTKTVLGKMKELGFINEEQYNTAVAEVDNKLAFVKGDATKITSEFSYEVESALEQIIEQMVEEKGMTREMAEMKLFSGGYKIYTTQKTNIQNILEEEVLKGKYAITSGGQTAMSAMTIIDHTTGNVVASACAVGSGEERTARTRFKFFNYPENLKKPTGSSMKPLSVIAPGLETGAITGATVFYDGATTFGGGYSPKNQYAGYRGLMNIRHAIAISSNVPNVKALATSGMDRTYQFLTDVGIKTNGNEGLPLALGGFDGTSTLHMAAGYAAIANDGVYIEPTFYTKVEDKDGNTYMECKPMEDRCKRVMSADNAYIEKNILTSVVRGGGTGTYCAIGGIDVAAKTGTTNGDYDRWLCGFTPYYTGACWFGYEKNAEVRYGGNPSNPAGSIWSSVMKQVHQGMAGAKFKPTENIITVNVCSESGKLPSPGCPTYAEVFVRGTQPSTKCDVHTSITVCTDSGCIANEYCQNKETRLIRHLPEKEANQKMWSTNYGADINSKLPENCIHKAADFKKEYHD